MLRMIYWMLAIAGSIAVLVLAASRTAADPRMAWMHIAVAALVAIVLALLGIRETEARIAGGGSRHAVAASKIRSMGLVWTWCALGMLATYSTGVLAWKEWWHFTIPLIIVAGLCLYAAASLDRDDGKGATDEAMLKLLSYLGRFQLAGMVIAMLGLLIDGKMTRFMKEAGRRVGWQDWAANNFFFFGALALAALSLHAISRNARGDGGRSV